MKFRKAEKRLMGRRRDFDAMKSSRNHEGTVQQRLESGGYHRPGSMKK